MTIVARARAGLARTVGKVALALAVAALAAQGLSPAASASTLNYRCQAYQTCVWVNFALRSDGTVQINSVEGDVWAGGGYTVGFLRVCETRPNSYVWTWCQDFPTPVCGWGGCYQAGQAINQGYTYWKYASLPYAYHVSKGTGYMARWVTLAGDSSPTGPWACLRVEGNYSVNC